MLKCGCSIGKDHIKEMKRNKYLTDVDAEIQRLRSGICKAPEEVNRRKTPQNVFDPTSLATVGRSSKNAPIDSDVHDYLRHAVKEWKDWEMEDVDFETPDTNGVKFYLQPQGDPFSNEALSALSARDSVCRLSEATVFRTVFERGATVEELELASAIQPQLQSTPSLLTTQSLYDVGSALNNSRLQQRSAPVPVSAKKTTKKEFMKTERFCRPSCTSKIIASGEIFFCPSCGACQLNSEFCDKCSSTLKPTRSLASTKEDIDKIAKLEEEEQQAFRAALLEWRSAGSAQPPESNQKQASTGDDRVHLTSQQHLTLLLPNGKTYFTSLLSYIQ